MINDQDDTAVIYTGECVTVSHLVLETWRHGGGSDKVGGSEISNKGRLRMNNTRPAALGPHLLERRFPGAFPVPMIWLACVCVTELAALSPIGEVQLT